MQKKYDFEEFYEDFKKHEKLYKNVKKDLPTLALVHSPEFSNDDKCVNLFKDYDLILCGHTHDGCIPFGFGNFKRGLISPKKTFFPKNVRGLRKLDNNCIYSEIARLKFKSVRQKYYTLLIIYVLYK